MPDQYKIPQNIDVEDKILGPFTLRQFLYIMVAGILIYVLFNIFASTNVILFVALSAPIAIAAVALVFIKVNERPFADFFFYFLSYLQDPKEKKWAKSTKVKEFNITARVAEEEKQKQNELANLSRRGIAISQLEQLSVVLDSKGWSQQNLNQELKGRISSSTQEESDIKKRFTGEAAELEDIFGDIEGAVSGLQTGVQEQSANTLADRLKILLE